MLKKHLGACVAGLLVIVPFAAAADEVTVEMHLIDKKGVGKSLGTVHASDGSNGLILKLNLAAELSPGPHGFHVHENPSCESAEKDGDNVAGLAAGGHFDPAGTGKHLGSGGEGHLGDLPVLYVETDEDGTQEVKHSLVAPRLKVSDIRGRSLMIHAMGDNFRDEPKPLGGGGARVACGVIE